MKKILIITGTRPEIIKMSPIIRKLNKQNLLFIHTGQHYDYNLSLKFIKDLSLPKPNINFQLTSSDPTSQISEIILKLKKKITSENVSMMCVEGDTNTVLACSIFALKNKIPIAHIESGLRSMDWRMPEEHNRIMVDHISDLLFAPTKDAQKNLNLEKVHGKIFVTGNTVIDALEQHVPMALKKSKIKIPKEDYILLTLHRPENVDNGTILSNLINAVISLPYTVLFPIHPRTKQNLKRFGLDKKLKTKKDLILLPPQGYFDFLKIMKYCKFIITDSGGIQEEATSPSLRKFTIVVRKTTDRPEAVKAGFAKVVGMDSKKIMQAVEKQLNIGSNKLPRKSPYGSGNSANKILKILKKHSKI